jgi:hypothetical protein
VQYFVAKGFSSAAAIAALGALQMKFLASPIARLIGCLLFAGAAEAQQAEGSTGAAPPQGVIERPHTGVKVSASKKTQTPGKKSALARPPLDHEDLPCPRATWKYDPVCADAPDEHTLPTPSMHGAASQQRDGALKVQLPGAENLAVGVDWQANNAPRLPGYDSVPMLDSVRKNIPDATVSSPDTRMGLGLDLEF